MLPCAIVEFEDQSCAIICSKWFTSKEEDACYWPPSNAPTSKLLRGQHDVGENWRTYRVRVLGKAETYERALEKLKQAEDTPDLATDTEPSVRKKRKPRNLFDSSDSSDNEGSTSVDRLMIVPSIPSSKLTSVVEDYVPHHTVSSPLPSVFSPPSGQAPLRTPSTTQSIPSVGNQNMFTKILKLLEDIKQTQRVQGAQLQVLMHNTREISTEPTASLPGDVMLPLTTLDAFEHFEEVLAEEDLFNTMKYKLRDLGGRTVGEFVKRSMSYIFVNDLCGYFTVRGKNGKRPFGTSKTFDVVFQAAKKNFHTLETTKKDLEVALGKWFLGARDRGGNRRARRAARM